MKINTNYRDILENLSFQRMVSNVPLLPSEIRIRLVVRFFVESVKLVSYQLAGQFTILRCSQVLQSAAVRAGYRVHQTTQPKICFAETKYN